MREGRAPTDDRHRFAVQAQAWAWVGLRADGADGTDAIRGGSAEGGAAVSEDGAAVNEDGAAVGNAPDRDPPLPDAAVRVEAMPGCAIPERMWDVSTPVALSGPAMQGRADVRVTLVVVQGSVPIGADELGLLTRASTPPGAVVFVLAGPGADNAAVGSGTATSGAVVDRNRRVLAEFAPGFECCPFVPADAPVAVLGSAIDAAVGYATTADMQSAGAVAAVDAELARRRRRAARVRDEVARDESVLRKQRAALASRRVELRTTESLPARMTELRTGLSQARVDLGHEIAARCRRATADVGSDLEGADRASVREYPDRLRRRLDRADEALAELVYERFAAAAPAAASGSDVSDPDASGSGAPAPGRAGSANTNLAPLSVPGPRPRSRTTEDHLTILMGASGGLGLGRLVVSTPVAGALPAAVSWPAAIVVGAFIGWWIVRSRAHLGERARTRQWAGEVIAEFRARWERYVSGRALEVESRAVRSVGAEHARADRRIDGRIGRIDARLAACGEGAARRKAGIDEGIAFGERIRAALLDAALPDEAAMPRGASGAEPSGTGTSEAMASGAVDSGRRVARTTPYGDL